MLTFEFSGVEGRMTVTDTLTSGMVGREAALSFDDSWAGLTKTVVFRAGDVCRIAEMAQSPVTIPADVLAHPFRKLYVGVYGSSSGGALVIPTIMAEGPYIRYGADPTEDSTAEELPVWKKLQAQIGDLEDLDTEAKDNLVAAINELHAEIPNIGHTSGSNSAGSSGLSAEAAALLITILRHAVYTVNQSVNIDALEAALNAQAGDNPGSGGTDGSGGETGGSTGNESGGSDSGGGGDSGSTGEEPTTYRVICHLTNVTISNNSNTVISSDGYSATLIAAAGYALGSVMVTMGGTDVTASAYAAGKISISSVTGDIVITAIGKSAQTETLKLVTTASYPDVTTFEYAEGSSTQGYLVAKQSTIPGGLLRVNYDPEIYNNWNLNLYVFKNGAPYCQTDKAGSDLSGELYWNGETKPYWENPGNASGFGIVTAPFTVRIPEGGTFISCIRRGNAATGTGTAGTSSSADFVEWVKSGGITFTVTG